MNKYLNKFKYFVSYQSSFNNEEQVRILGSFEDYYLQRRFSLVLILFSWTAASFFIESFLIGGGVVFSLIHGIDWVYFLPELSFILLNFFGKFIYIRWYMKKEISLAHTIYASLPAVGPLIIFGILIRDNVLLLQAFRKYIVYRRKTMFRKKQADPITK